MGYTVTSTNTAACNLGPPPPPPNGILGKVLSYRISSKSDYGFTYTKKFTYEEELNQVFLMRQLAWNSELPEKFNWKSSATNLYEPAQRWHSAADSPTDRHTLSIFFYAFYTKPRNTLQRFFIIGSPERACKNGTQTADHLIFLCKRLQNERQILKNSVLKVGNWPVSKSELTNRNLKQLIRYLNSMDLENIYHPNEQM